jgi:hypothetical protein
MKELYFIREYEKFVRKSEIERTSSRLRLRYGDSTIIGQNKESKNTWTGVILFENDRKLWCYANREMKQHDFP